VVHLGLRLRWLGPIIIAAGLTPNTTSVFCHARAVPADLSDSRLEDWAWDTAPIYCGNATNDLTPFDAPSGAWETGLKQWQYVDGSECPPPTAAVLSLLSCPLSLHDSRLRTE
jgi:hypothetical protein